MSGFIGADPGELRDLGKNMDSSAEQLERVRTDLLSFFQRVRWAGEDANRAKGEFRTGHAKRMQQVTSLLRDTADLVRKQAQEQAQASSHGSIFPPGVVIAQPLPAIIPGPRQVPPPNLVTLPGVIDNAPRIQAWSQLPETREPEVCPPYEAPESP